MKRCIASFGMQVEFCSAISPQAVPGFLRAFLPREAQGWVFGANGEVILTASAPTVMPQSPMMMPPICDGD